jgi:glyoxylase-like metal-dependent hydrolase (beta-lactamase superfamily II)/rhodanese-related sulfurtransferase
MAVEWVVLETPELGDRSYLVHDGRVAVVIDPQRDLDRIVSAARSRGVGIVCVAETHIHNDYVSGGAALSRALSALYLVAAGEAVSFDRRRVYDGEEIQLAVGFSLRALSTPGHSPHHLSYVVNDFGTPVAVCTGGSLLFGTGGRTDVAGPDSTAEMTHLQYRSMRSLGELSDDVAVLPTHGFGSFCSAGAAVALDQSTIGEQRRTNPAFTSRDEQAFVATLLAAGPRELPRYFAHMALLNRKGAPAPDLSPPTELGGRQLRLATRLGAWVIDVRPRASFAAGHLAGSINAEYALPFATYLGWTKPWDAPLVLVSDDATVASAAQRDLSRIGIDHIAGRYVGPLPEVPGGPPVSRYPIRGFGDIPKSRVGDGIVVVDVRTSDEWDAGHLDGALHVALPDLAAQVDRLPAGQIWVHCAAGYRAGLAASLVHRAGRDVVLVNDSYDVLSAA